MKKIKIKLIEECCLKGSKGKLYLDVDDKRFVLPNIASDIASVTGKFDFSQ